MHGWGTVVSCELQRYSVDVVFMPSFLILKLEMPLPFARISFVPTTSLSCVEKSGCQRCVCAHEKTRIEALSGIGTTALQLFFVPWMDICNWMTVLALLATMLR